jgi:hypothetical protein
MSRMRLLLFVVHFGIFVPVFADEAKQPTTQQLIEQLGHERYSVREKAYKMLQLRGPSVLSELKKAITHKEDEVRTRAAKLISILEKLAALETKRVTLQVDQEPLSVVLHQIQKQTGYQVASKAQNDDKRYSFHRKGISFWDAIEEIRKAAKVPLTVSTPMFPIQTDFFNRPLELRGRLASNSGPFRIELVKIHENKYVSFDDPTQEESPTQADPLVTFSFEVRAEPKFFILSTNQPIIESITDEHGNQVSLASLTTGQQGQLRDSNDAIGRIINPSGRTGNGILDATIKRLSIKLDKIKELKGRIPVVVIVDRKDRILSEKLPQLKQKKIDTHQGTVEIANIRQPSKDKFRLRFVHPFHDGGLLGHRFRIIDENGNPIVGTRNGGNAFNPESLDYEYTIPHQAGENSPLKLVFDEWIIVDYEIPFVFKDIPLP